MQLTIYYKEDDKWLVEKIESKAYGDRKSVSQVILTILDQYFTAQEGGSPRPATPRQRKKPGPKPGSKRRKPMI
jgi:hypothetical protein